MSKIRTTLIAGGVFAAAIGALATSAVADPPSGVTPTHLAIVGTGSDTTQFTVDAFSSAFNKTKPARKMYSYDAVNPVSGSTVTTIPEKRGCGPRTRPNGSSAGIAELEANLHPKNDSADYCVDFARSSRGRTAGIDPSSILFLPFAIDGVTWSADKSTGHSNATLSLSTHQLNAIYSCDASTLNSANSGPVTWKEVGGTSTDQIVPVIPQSSSGTRKFFLQEIGVSTLGQCVKGQDDTVEENEGTNDIFRDPTLAPDIVFPYSVAVYLAQSQSGHGAGDQGKQILRQVNHANALVGKTGSKTINPNFPYLREVYNVVRNTSKNGDQVVPKYLRPLFGNGTAGTGWVCTSKAAKSIIKSYGFLPTSRCGAAE